jgi:hypothetical protein
MSNSGSMTASDSLGRESKLKADVNLNRGNNMSDQIHSFGDLQQQIHQDLRVQHPDWIEPNGDCPRCDSYESRLADLLGLSHTPNAVRMSGLTFPGDAADY